MLKKWSFIALLLTAVAFCACDNGDNEPVDIKVDCTLNTGHGALIPKNGTTLPSITVILANAKGESVSMALVSDTNFELGQPVLIPAGKYTFSEMANVDKSILSSFKSFFVYKDSKDNKNSRAVTGGEANVSYSGGTYSITGKLDGESNTTLNFSFSGAISVTDPRMSDGEDLALAFTTAETCYDNRFIDSDLFVYQTVLKNESGQKLGLEFFAPVATTAYFNRIANGDYTLATIENQMGNFKINPSDKTYYTNEEGISYFLSDAGLKIERNGTNYSITGTVLLEDGQTATVSFAGAMPIAKAYMNFGASELYVVGQMDNYSIYAYYFMLNSGKKNGIGEELYIYATGPINRYYDYLPMKAEHYAASDVSWGYLTPYIISTNHQIADNGLSIKDLTGKLRRDAENHKILYTTSGGYMDLTSGKVSGGYRFDLSGVLDITIDGQRTELHYKYGGVIEDNGEDIAYLYGTHPYSTASGNLTFNNFKKGIYWRAENGYWNDNGAADDTGFLLITLATEEGEFDEWMDDDMMDPSHRFMMIALNIDPDTPEDVIPVGEYKIDDGWSYAPFTFMPGSKWGMWSNMFLSTMIFNGTIGNSDYETVKLDVPFGYGTDGGKITIAKDASDIYTITFNCYDDLGVLQANKISGKYVGEIIEEGEYWGWSMNKHAAKSKNTAANKKANAAKTHAKIHKRNK